MIKSNVVRFPTFEAYNAAKLLPLQTISLGDPVYEKAEDGTLTGAFLCFHPFTAEMEAELNSYGIFLYQAPEPEATPE